MRTHIKVLKDIINSILVIFMFFGVLVWIIKPEGNTLTFSFGIFCFLLTINLLPEYLYKSINK